MNGVADETIIFDFYGRNSALEVLIHRHSPFLATFFRQKSNDRERPALVKAAWDCVKDSKTSAGTRFTPAANGSFKAWLQSIAELVFSPPGEHEDVAAPPTRTVESEKADETLIAEFYGDDSAIDVLIIRQSVWLAEYFLGQLGVARPDLVERTWTRIRKTKDSDKGRYERSKGLFNEWLEELARDVWLGDRLCAYYACVHPPETALCATTPLKRSTANTGRRCYRIHSPNPWR